MTHPNREELAGRQRTWRTNVGLRLTPDDGAWLTAHCERENRSLANYVELLIRRDRASKHPQPSVEEIRAVLENSVDAELAGTCEDRAEVVAESLEEAAQAIAALYGRGG